MLETDIINWPIPSEFPALRHREIHLWCARLGANDDAVPDDLDCLSPDEVARAESFHFTEDRVRFVAARRNLRQVLAHYAGRDAAALAFSYGRFGKPMLIHRAATTGPLDPTVSNLSFNQSHCGSLWLLAVAWNQPVGVDVEQLRDLSDLYLVESKIFATTELFRQRSLPHAERQLAFFRRWTEREASAKFHGQGFDPSMPFVPPDQIVPLNPAENCVATLAYGGTPIRLRQFQWPQSGGVFGQFGASVGAREHSA